MAKKKPRKLPKNPAVGKTYNITVNSKSGKRKVGMKAMKKKGFGKYKIVSNKPAN